MNWLAQLTVDSEIINRFKIRDNYCWHQRLWEDCFPNNPDAKRDFLTRIDLLDGVVRAWVLSVRKPATPAWCQSGRFAVKEISPTFLSHRYYAFDLKANPVKTIARKNENGEQLYRADGKKAYGKRIPLTNLEELKAWLQRKGRARSLDTQTKTEVPGGFQIVESKPLEISPMVENHFRTKKGAAYHGGVQFRGTLEVTNPAYFARTYREGIGSAKGFGFGLLLLAPINF